MSELSLDALLRQAGELRQSGDLDRAREACNAALERSPEDPRALTLLADIAADLREIDEGLRWGLRASAADPGSAAAHYALGRLWELAGRLDQAEASYCRVIGLDPSHARAYNNLGSVLSYRGRLDEALACFQQALLHDPGLVEANHNYAAITSDSAKLERATQGYLAQARKDPSDARALVNLANIYAGQGRFDDAMAALDRAIALEPDRAEAQFARAPILLIKGDYAAGWAAHQWRWRLDNPMGAPGRRFAQPFWDGGDLAGGTLFVHGEIALGEVLQFVRYLRLAAMRCGHLVIETAARLAPLLRSVEGIDQITSPDDPAPRFDAHIPLMALPKVFGTTLQNIPWTGPYLRADPGRVEQARPLFDAAGPARLKVGLAWSGNPRLLYNRDRAIPPAALAPLQAVEGAALFNLQQGEVAGSVPDSPLRLIDLTAHERDFLDTAAFVSRLDLMITVDSMMAHLAGGLGVPVWVLLCRTPDWRHHLERTDNPWYPTMRLYRQTRDGAWDDVVMRVTDDLRALAAATRAKSS